MQVVQHAKWKCPPTVEDVTHGDRQLVLHLARCMDQALEDREFLRMVGEVFFVKETWEAWQAWDRELRNA